MAIIMLALALALAVVIGAGMLTWCKHSENVLAHREHMAKINQEAAKIMHAQMMEMRALETHPDPDVAKLQLEKAKAKAAEAQARAEVARRSRY